MRCKIQRLHLMKRILRWKTVERWDSFLLANAVMRAAQDECEPLNLLCDSPPGPKSPNLHKEIVMIAMRIISSAGEIFDKVGIEEVIAPRY